MDPYSAEGELSQLHTAFHTAQYRLVTNYDTSSLSDSNALPARILQLRSRIALGEAAEVSQELQSEKASSPDLAAVAVFADYVNAKGSSSKQEAAAKEMDDLITKQSDNLSVQLLGGTILARTEREAEALSLLNKHQGSLDAVALIVQIHLAQNRLDLAQAEVRKARGWAQDSLLVNIAESWVGLREGGQHYQSAFYVYEELATAPPTSNDANNTSALLSQSLCELHLGRLPEAEAAMATCLQQEPESPDVLANAVVLYTISGKTSEARSCRDKLAGIDPEHELLRDITSRSEAFESAKAKYQPVFEVDG